MQVLSSLTREAEAEGLRLGQPLRDARAMCPTLVTRLANPARQAEFLAVLRRWGGKFSPWVAAEAPSSLVIDLTGCAHLFGGEEALMLHAIRDCQDLGLSVCGGIADTLGAAWALARFSGNFSGGFSGGDMLAGRNGDAIDQEARATRSRAVRRRHWERGGPAPVAPVAPVAIAGGAGRNDGPARDGQDGTPANPLAGLPARIAPPGQTRLLLAPLPLSALRLDAQSVTELSRLGLRRVEDLLGMPRAALARRFGQDVVRRLDQALGVEPEPVSPARPGRRFAVRLTLPDPIGLEDDILAAIDRLLPPLAAHLRKAGRGARRLRLQCFRADHTLQTEELGLARPTDDPDRMRPLLRMKVADIDAGFGIDAVRIEAVVTEPLHARQHKGHMGATRDAEARRDGDTGLDDLIGRLGARLGLDSITRWAPADSHIPEKAALTLAAAWAAPPHIPDADGADAGWPRPPVPRPLLMFRPELVMAHDRPAPPGNFRWRRRAFVTQKATGPERIAPEWWLDEAEWRSGVRDYWRIDTAQGDRLWLYFAHGGSMSAGWFCQGVFA